MVRLLGTVAAAIVLLGIFFRLDSLHARVLLALWPEYPHALPFQGGNMWEMGVRTVQLVLLATVLCTAIGVPLGIVATRPRYRDEWAPIVNGLVNAGQTVPSLAIVALALPLLGFGFVPALLAMLLNGLLPVLRNTAVALESVDKAQIEAGLGMGMTPRQLLWMVEIPRSIPVILAGIRTSAVLNVGVAVLAGLIGAGGFGAAIVHGIDLRVPPLVWYGAVPTALLAVIMDFFLRRLEEMFTPRGLRLEEHRS
ncbi:MAG: ABC transporter permease [Firmicutes bacterium]|nr:ABC transporter permease [Bacillota bacterium]